MAEKFFTETSKNYALLDKNTGEILDYKEVKKVNIEDFLMVFLKSIPEVCKLEGLQIKILMCCWRYSSLNLRVPEANRINNNTLFKNFVRENIKPDLSDGAIDVTLTKLVRTGLLIRECKGQYALNPEYFFKGTLSNRSKLSLTFQVVNNESNN